MSAILTIISSVLAGDMLLASPGEEIHDTKPKNRMAKPPFTKIAIFKKKWLLKFILAKGIIHMVKPNILRNFYLKGTKTTMMKKILVRVFLGSLFLFGLYVAYRYYGHYQEEKRRATYYENLVDTSSPTVVVLRDSILISYQNEKRTIHVYVPPNYERDSVTRYPVMYFMDGESSFNDLENMGPEWQIDEVINAASTNGQPTAIVIGINQAEDRDAEYTPFVNEDNPDAHGAEFAQWVSTELKQWVDTHYRTQPEASSTTIGGISRSGMMAYFMLMAHPGVFGNAVIQSPSMWVDYDRLMAMNLSPSQLNDKKIFISVGEHEGNIMIPHAKDIYEKFKAQGLKADQLRFDIIPGEGHWHVTWRKSFALAYPWLM